MELMGTDPDAVAERLVYAEDALRRIARIPNKTDGGDWDKIEGAREIAESFLLSNSPMTRRMVRRLTDLMLRTKCR